MLRTKNRKAFAVPKVLLWVAIIAAAVLATVKIYNGIKSQTEIFDKITKPSS